MKRPIGWTPVALAGASLFCIAAAVVTCKNEDASEQQHVAAPAYTIDSPQTGYIRGLPLELSEEGCAQASYLCGDLEGRCNPTMSHDGKEIWRTPQELVCTYQRDFTCNQVDQACADAYPQSN